jgi:chemotaxis protein methyltransferase CheR
VNGPAMFSPPALTQADFRKISELAYQRFGLNLPPGKEGLVATRLGKKIRQGGFSTFAEYHRHVLADSTGEALIGLIDALTTNFTSFLRERAHFDLLTHAATTEFRDEPSFRVWSAACSSGEEPYSIVMSLLDAAQSTPCRWSSDLRVLATDISTRVLDKARAGIYEANRFESIPDPWRRGFLLKGTGNYEGSFKIKPSVAAHVQFARLNLIEPLPAGCFHFVFCRNVMIYFDKPTQQDIVRRLAEHIEPGGYFFVGHSETLNSIDHPLQYVRPAVYRKDTKTACSGRRG